MSRRRDGSTPISETFGRFLTDKGKGDGGSSGNYRREAERELDRFLAWARGKGDDPANASPPESWNGILPSDTPGEASRDVRFSDLDATVMSDYARYLVASGYANSTVQTYYAYVASWCGWASKQGYLSRNYARESDAEDPLPDNDGRRPGDQPAWDSTDRDRITRHVDEQAEAAIDVWFDIDVDVDERGDLESDAVREKARARREAIAAARDRVLVYLLCYTGLRGAEFLADPDDDRPGRNGLRWQHVSFGDKAATVFRKNQQWMEASLPDPVLGPLERYKELLDPGEDWPVIPTLHRPTLAQHVQEGLREAGVDTDEIEALRDAKPDLVLAAEYDLSAPPALKPNGARRVMKRLSEAAGLEIDDEHGYLTPHGGRRGMGEVMVREFGYAAAARYLDNSEEMVREAYQHIEAADRADQATEALSRTDQRVRGDEREEKGDSG